MGDENADLARVTREKAVEWKAVEEEESRLPLFAILPRRP
jgi:hypothetical protein